MGRRPGGGRRDEGHGERGGGSSRLLSSAFCRPRRSCCARRRSRTRGGARLERRPGDLAAPGRTPWSTRISGSERGRPVHVQAADPRREPGPGAGGSCATRPHPGGGRPPGAAPRAARDASAAADLAGRPGTRRRARPRAPRSHSAACADREGERLLADAVRARRTAARAAGGRARARGRAPRARGRGPRTSASLTRASPRRGPAPTRPRPQRLEHGVGRPACRRARSQRSGSCAQRARRSRRARARGTRGPRPRAGPAPRAARRGRARARPARRRGTISVRPQPAGRQRGERADRVEREAAAVALVGEARLHVAVAQHHAPLRRAPAARPRPRAAPGRRSRAAARPSASCPGSPGRAAPRGPPRPIAVPPGSRRQHGTRCPASRRAAAAACSCRSPRSPRT